ncbi:spermidine/putrescine transport system permease protein PotB [Moorella mulderi DSM 14980]|uniref:Spermidine/putrescine transport system permease protein PotB n=1 Tax=Moorella mulderi DSM 14980 TaxID=1122241 RepID=A0A151AVN9_9FIRM|nr:spermidine/putrescine transport system permease protein PotB [Moorella mulderi DSM 14980]
MTPQGQRGKVAPTFLLLVPSVLLISFLLVAPYGYMVPVSFCKPGQISGYEKAFTLANYAKALGDSYYLRIMMWTLVYSIGTTLGCLLLGYPVAYYLARTRTKWKGLLMIGILSPLLVGVVIRCYGWMVLLADNGLVNSLLGRLGIGPFKLMYNPFGVMLALVHINLPFMILTLTGSIQTIDPVLEEAAQSLGASPRRTFFSVTLPMSLPGVYSGTLLVFLQVVSAYAIPVLLGGFQVMMTPILVVQQVIDIFNWPFGSALAIVLFIVSGLIIWLYTRAMNRLMRGLA